MLIRDAIQDRAEQGLAKSEDVVRLRLPTALKTERMSVRNGLLKRLASSRAFALGDRAGVLRAAQNRSGRPFRLDVRQRVIVKALVCRHVGKGALRGAALAKHVVYLGRAGAGVDGARPEFFDKGSDGLDAALATSPWPEDRHHFRFIISPEHGDRIADFRGYVRDVMGRVSADLGEPQMEWLATCHFDTDQPHAHVLVRGLRGDGRDLVIPRDYMGYGFRARAQEAAQERLGDLTRLEAERRIWKETQADRFTGFDRRLLGAIDADGLVPDGVGGHDAWAALTRGRLLHLEALGLAVRSGRRYRLDPRLEENLRTLQARRDVLRTLNQRRLETGRDVVLLGEEPVRGAVVKTGFHDEAGAAPWVVIRDREGRDVFARLSTGALQPTVGTRATLVRGPSGVPQLDVGRGAGLER